MKLENEMNLKKPTPELLEQVQKYIDINYIEDVPKQPKRNAATLGAAPKLSVNRFFSSSFALKEECLAEDEGVFELDESFSEMLFRKIDESGMKDSECYKKANVSKQIFSNIKSNEDYIPKKNTVLAFAIALKLDLDDTKDLLERAGYALSKSRLFDVIVEYFVVNEKYDIDEINSVLFEYDQTLLGSK